MIDATQGPLFITGASGTIGHACASALIERGVPVVLHAHRHPERLQDLVEAAHIREVPMLVVQGDLAHRETCDAIFEGIRKRFGGIKRILICHGTSQIALFQDQSDSELHESYASNLLATAHVIQAATHQLLQEGSGSIVVVSSMWGVVGSSMEAWYSAQKAAIHGLILSLAKELGPSHIRLNAIAAGFIDSPMNGHLSEEEIQDFAEATPLGRVGVPEDLMPMIFLLLSDASQWVTGQIITIDGGYTL